MGAQGWLRESSSQGGMRLCLCLCLRVDDPQWELLQRCLFALLSGSRSEFHYNVMELSLLHIPRSCPMCGAVSVGRWQVGRAAIRLQE